MDEWTKEKICETVKEIKQNGIINYRFGYNKPIELEYLNEYAFSERPDLILNISPNNRDYILTQRELLLLSKLNNVKKLHLNNINNTYLLPVRNMKNITSLEITTFNSITDLLFIDEFIQLKELIVRGTVRHMEAIGKCSSLEYLHLSTTINDYGFIKPLKHLKSICIDNCLSTNDFSLLNKPSLEDISIISIQRLKNTDSIKELKHVKKIRLHAIKLKVLPAMDSLTNLRELELSHMKSWENPEIIKTIPKLEKLKLCNITTELKAERFYFLSEIKTLKELDIRFIDRNKTRINKLTGWLTENGKQHIIVH
ncbi:MAG: hypothetical protein LBJ63_06965 [Prevotellaceae bacterium]|jgi:hypothetical protein|nr:hypothetical protein [Prevotellaceae bacterium]